MPTGVDSLTRGTRNPERAHRAPRGGRGVTGGPELSAGTAVRRGRRVLTARQGGSSPVRAATHGRGAHTATRLLTSPRRAPPPATLLRRAFVPPQPVPFFTQPPSNPVTRIFVSVSGHLFLFCLLVFQRFHINVKSRGVCFSLTDSFHSAQFPSGPSVSLQMVGFLLLLFFFLAESHFVVYMHPVFFIRSSVDGHSGGLRILATVNNTAGNTGPQIAFPLRRFCV